MRKISSKSALVADCYEGYIIDLVKAVTEVAGLNYTLHDTSSYRTLVNDLVDDKLDLVVADIIITKERLMMIDFSLPFMTAGLTIIMKKPSVTDPDPFSFLSPFSSSIWLYILAAYVVASFLLAAVSR